MPQIADGEFQWDTITNDPGTGVSQWTTNGYTLANALVKWDSLGRDNPGAIATATTRMFKGPQLLEKVLANSSSADVLVLATWNDLGEGTGINRNYDYYYQGQWMQPDAFMQIVRQTNCAN